MNESSTKLQDTISVLQVVHDTMVDGPFILAQRDPDLVFRGSANQRVIDVPASLRRGEVVTIPHPEDLF